MNSLPRVSAEPSAPKSGKLRRILMIVVALIGLMAAAVLVVGMIEFPEDRPPVGYSNGNPGSGGLRRPFPAMNQRANNPTTPEKTELGRLLFFDPVLSGDNTQSCATCHHPDLGLSDGRSQSMGFGGTGVGPERKDGTVTEWNSTFGSVMLELAVPIIQTLTATPGVIDPQAAMAFFLVGAVHVALMALVMEQMPNKKVARLAADDCFIPLGKAATIPLPSRDDIVAAARALVSSSSRSRVPGMPSATSAAWAAIL